MKMLRNAGGFSLVEILVAAIILSLAIMALVAAGRKSHEFDITYQHHRVARDLITAALESSAYQYTNYDNMTDSKRQVIIDERDPADKTDDLAATLVIIVSPEKKTPGGGVGSPAVIYKDITATITWQEPEGSQTVTVVKSVADKI
jgi:type II secretory pathway pseudopilin PulG